jgi:hypothetical protein
VEDGPYSRAVGFSFVGRGSCRWDDVLGKSNDLVVDDVVVGFIDVAAVS